MKIVGGNDLTGGTVVRFVEEAEKSLLLVSPYFRPWGRLTTAIKSAVQVRGVRVTLLVRAPEVENADGAILDELRAAGVRVMVLTRLHAKLYVSESRALISSMNLLESSALDSWEIGVALSRREDASLFRQTIDQATDLLRRSEEEAARPAPPIAAKKGSPPKGKKRSAGRPRASKKRSAGPVEGQERQDGDMEFMRGRLRWLMRAGGPPPPLAGKGVCIRCSALIELDPLRPLCEQCFESWDHYKNAKHPEAVCHRCGGVAKTTAAKPVCPACFSTGAR